MDETVIDDQELVGFYGRDGIVQRRAGPGWVYGKYDTILYHTTIIGVIIATTTNHLTIYREVRYSLDLITLQHVSIS